LILSSPASLKETPPTKEPFDSAGSITVESYLKTKEKGFGGKGNGSFELHYAKVNIRHRIKELSGHETWNECSLALRSFLLSSSSTPLLH